MTVFALALLTVSCGDDDEPDEAARLACSGLRETVDLLASGGNSPLLEASLAYAGVDGASSDDSAIARSSRDLTDAIDADDDEAMGDAILSLDAACTDLGL